MSRKKKKWLIRIGVAAGLTLGVLFAAGVWLSNKFEPYIRDQTAAYLSKRFACDAEFASLKVRMGLKSALEVLLNKGRGAMVHVSGEGLALRPKQTPQTPLLAMKKFSFEVDLGSLWERPALVRRVRLEGLEINLPPKGQRPSMSGKPAEAPSEGKAPAVRIQEVIADGARYVMLPKDPEKAPLVFDIHKLTLTDAGPGVAMRYRAELTNAKPPGLIRCEGTLGPWITAKPSETPLTGKYVFEKADLGVFKGIAGTLASTGQFKGVLNELEVDGETRTPDFRLTSAGNAVKLTTKYHAFVDGTNGNTLLEPVTATLGSTVFECKGGVVRYAGEKGKTVDLDVKMLRGRLDDVLHLAMKGDRPLMTGGMTLALKFKLPPGKGAVEDKLVTSGVFKLKGARFTSAEIQSKLDDLSRRAQGKPSEEGLTDLPVEMGGRFDVAGGVIRFPELKFAVPGAQVELTGSYSFSSEAIDFHGTSRTDARLSQMMKTGWKRLALKPVDPFFAKQGSGTVFNIAITGTREAPKFGRE